MPAREVAGTQADAPCFDCSLRNKKGWREFGNAQAVGSESSSECEGYDQLMPKVKQAARL